MAGTQYEEFIRTRITELRLKKDVSEHRMSLDLGKSGSYIRGITSGAALPSFREFFNIVSYFGMTAAEFFAPMENGNSRYQRLCERLRQLDADDLEKIETVLDWIGK